MKSSGCTSTPIVAAGDAENGCSDANPSLRRSRGLRRVRGCARRIQGNRPPRSGARLPADRASCTLEAIRNFRVCESSTGSNRVVLPPAPGQSGHRGEEICAAEAQGAHVHTSSRTPRSCGASRRWSCLRTGSRASSARSRGCAGSSRLGNRPLVGPERSLTSATVPDKDELEGRNALRRDHARESHLRCICGRANRPCRRS